MLAAVDAGVDAVDAAMDALSGNTSQPCLGSIVEALKGGERDPGLDTSWIRRISFYWEAVRNQYAAFESDLKGPASEVYLHEMPGGQFTNLKEQARSLGLETRWHEVAQAYADANRMFGDIVKVTPSSKVVGDMALMMVSQDLTVADVENPAKDVSFPESVVSMLKGDLGQPPGGWPEGLQKKALKGEPAYTEVPGSLLPPADLAAERKAIEEKLEREISEYEFASYLMYPKVFTDFAAAADLYGPVSALPTPTYFYGLPVGEEVFVDIEKGKRSSSSTRPRAWRMTRAWSLCSSNSTASRAASRYRIAPTAPLAVRSAARRKPAMPPISARRCGRHLDGCRFFGSDRQGRRRDPLYRSDEDGNGPACRKGWHHCRSSGAHRRPDRRQGPADRLRRLSRDPVEQKTPRINPIRGVFLCLHLTSGQQKAGSKAGFLIFSGEKRLCAFLRRQNLTTTVHAGLQVDVVRTAKFAGILVFNVGRSLQRIGRTAHAALGRGSFSFRNSHLTYSNVSGKALSQAGLNGRMDIADVGNWRAYT